MAAKTPARLPLGAKAPIAVAVAAAAAFVLMFFRAGTPPPPPSPVDPPPPVTPAGPRALEIWFDPAPGDPGRAADLRCHVGTAPANTLTITATDSRGFLGEVEEHIDRWLNSGRGDGAEVRVYTRPYPGEGVIEALQRMGREKGVTVTRVDGPRPGGEST